MSTVYDGERDCAPLSFVVAPYLVREAGGLLPAIPREGPCRGSACPCRIVRDHLRVRKTGPEIPVLVARCLEHGRSAFTVYPPGFTPYGRQRMAPVALDGGLLGTGPGPDEPPGLARFDATIFRAAIDAAGGRFWDPEPLGYHSPPRWTQIRHLDRAADWLGLGSLPLSERHQQAEALGVEAQLLIESSRDLDSWRGRGTAVCRVLERLSPDRCVLDLLLRAGELAGLWGRPYRADFPGGRIREVVFPLPGTGSGGAVV